MRYRFDPPYPPYASRGRWASPSSDAHIRVSDAERSEVADKLSRHYADGRLDESEFRSRLERAMGATTRGDLDGLFDDLPRLDESPPPPPKRHRNLGGIVAVFVLIVLAMTLTFPVVHFPWLVFLLIAFFVWQRSGHRAIRRGPRSAGR